MDSHVEIQTVRDDPTRLEAMTVQELKTMMRQVLTTIHVFYCPNCHTKDMVFHLVFDSSFGGLCLCF